MARTSFWIVCFVFCLTYVCVKRCSCAACSSGTAFGASSLFLVDDYVGSATNRGTINLDNQFRINCCGVTTKWKVNVGNVLVSTTIYLQVWRPTGAGTQYWLVGQHNLTVNSPGVKSLAIPADERTTVQPGDVLGWWTNGVEVIRYNTGFDKADNNYLMVHTGVAKYEYKNWSSAAVVNDRTYAVQLTVGPSTQPSFTNLAATVNIVNAVPLGTSLYALGVTDPDPDDIASLVVTMTTDSGFSFESVTRVLSTAAFIQTSAVIPLTFRVTDTCGTSSINYLYVNVTNEYPVIHNLPDGTSVREDVILEKLLLQINASDSVSSVTCSLSTPYPFTVRPIPGLSAYGIYSNVNPAFDYDTKSVYSLNIACSDGQLVDTRVFTVNLIPNSPPSFVNLPAAVVLSTTSPIGFNVFTVACTDPENDALNFAISCVPAVCPFTIIASGTIFVSQDLTGHETLSYAISVTVSDAWNSVGPQILTVSFNDTNTPVTITNLPQTLTAQENTPLGGWSFQVSTHDPNTDQTRVFTLSSMPPSGINYFQINNGGLITTMGAVLDFETVESTSYTFVVTVSDPFTTVTGTITIDISDVNEPPSFNSDTYLISTFENIAGTIIGTPNYGVTDPDTGDMFTYSMVCNSVPGYIGIDPFTGQLTFLVEYDVDANVLPKSVTCDVTVTDNGGLTDSADITITINNDNDNAPVYYPNTFTFYVPHNAAVGAFVGKVTAKDADAGSYGVLTYSLDQAALTVPILAIDNNGVLRVAISPESAPLVIGTSANVSVTAKDVDLQSDVANVLIIIAGLTTPSPDRYRTFMTDERNVWWIALAGVGVLAIVVAIVCVSSRRASSSGKPTKNLKSTRIEDSTKEPSNTQSSRVFRTPPPKELQSWRQEMAATNF